MLALLCLAMMTCRKDVEPYVFNAEIKVSDIRAKQVLVEAINDEEGFEKLSAIVYYSTDEKLDEPKQYEMFYEDDRFKAYLTDLKADTRYYYKVVFHGKYNSVETEIDTFETVKSGTDDDISGTEKGHNYVDLGLSVKWATCNIGATSPEEYGDYFEWGETITKAEPNSNTPTYGLNISQLQSRGYIDSEGNLNPKYDAARSRWGSAWRIPTNDELNELVTRCIWIWTTQNGVNGYRVISKVNGNSIFLPAAGCRVWTLFDDAGSLGYYWSSEPYDDDHRSYSLYFNSSNRGMYWYYGRHDGHSVRPVISGDFEESEEEPGEPETPGTNQTFNVNGVSFTMIAVEGGTFQMGAQSSDSSGDNYDSDASSDESPVHSVTLSSYYIGETEVTQELWEAVMGSNPSYYSGYPQRPVEYFSLEDCREFITKLNQLTGKNFRLPTEAEWEYAARGGNKSMGYKYSGSNTIGDVAWYNDNSGYKTHDVKAKAANELGIYDMSGNVQEWCQDFYGDYSSGSQTNPTGPSSGSSRVLRGGGSHNSAGLCSVSDRDYNVFPSTHGSDRGLRLSLSQD